MKKTAIFLCFFFVIHPIFSSVEIIKNARITKYQSGNDTVSAYQVTPNGNGPFPAVILIHDEYGLDDWIKNNANTLSQKGYLTFAIDIYDGKTPKTNNDIHTIQNGLVAKNVIRDITCAYQFLTQQKEVNPKRIGMVGWGLGGSYALQAAKELRKLRAMVSCYGELIEDKRELRTIFSPVLTVDPSNREVVVTEFVSTMLSLNKKVGAQLYDHVESGFMREGDHFHQRSATHAWNEIYRFLQEKLKD